MLCFVFRMFDLRFIMVQDRFDKAKYQVWDVAVSRYRGMRCVHRAGLWRNSRSATSVSVTDWSRPGEERRVT